MTLLQIMDNATFHKSDKTKKLIEGTRNDLVFLPSYSPDLNPIEKFWANLKCKIKTVLVIFRRLLSHIDCPYRYARLSQPCFVEK
jgi:transposase